METQVEKRFDHLWKEALESHARLSMKCQSATNFLRQARKEAFRFTLYVMTMRREFPNDFLDQVSSLKDEAGKHMTVDQWLDDKYAALTAIGETQRDIERAINEGVTEKQYVIEGRLWKAKKEETRLLDAERAVVGMRPPPSTMTEHERLHYVQQQLDEARRTVVEQGKLIRLLRQEVERVKGVLASLERRIKRSLSNENEQAKAEPAAA